MPRGDRTGPMGAGPMTGRGAGICARYDTPGFANPVPRRSMQRGLGGGGHGWRRQFYATGLPRWARFAPPTPEQELAGLKDEAIRLKDQLDVINKHIEEFEQK